MAQEMKRDSIKDIQDGFALLQICEEDLPDYVDPYTFAESFKICSLKICSLYSENEAFSSDAVIIRNVGVIN